MLNAFVSTGKKIRRDIISSICLWMDSIIDMESVTERDQRILTMNLWMLEAFSWGAQVSVF